MLQARYIAALAVAIAIIAFSVNTVSAPSRAQKERVASAATAPLKQTSGVVQTIGDDVVSILDDTGSAEFSLGDLDASALTELREARAHRVHVTIDYRDEGDRRSVTKVYPTGPEGLKTMGDMTWEGLPAYPIFDKLPEGVERPEDVPIANVKVWDGRAMARLHAAATGDLSAEERAKLDFPVGMAPQAKPAERDELAAIRAGTGRDAVEDELGVPGHTTYVAHTDSTCAYWALVGDEARMAGVCFDAAGLAVGPAAVLPTVGYVDPRRPAVEIPASMTPAAATASRRDGPRDSNAGQG